MTTRSGMREDTQGASAFQLSLDPCNVIYVVNLTVEEQLMIEVT
jgi:hypothetical protein